MFRSMVVGTVGALALTVSANAADLYRGPAGGGYKDGPVEYDSWTGVYAGANGGYGWGANADNVILADTGLPAFALIPGIRPEGGFGGGQIGYNWQGLYHPRFVIGVEADIQGAGIQDSITYGPIAQTTAQRTTDTIDYFGTVRARFGFAVDHTLLYLTAGLAYGSLDYKISQLNNVGLWARNDTETGYVLGFGVEHKFTPHWSVKLEYQYIDFGAENINPVAGAPVNVASAGRNVEVNFNTVRLGVNYHIGPTYEPLK